VTIAAIAALVVFSVCAVALAVVDCRIAMSMTEQTEAELLNEICKRRVDEDWRRA